MSAAACRVCNGAAALMGSVDFARNCPDALHEAPFTESGNLIEYWRCAECGFISAPEMAAWSIETMKERVYNDGYAAFDPDYVNARPRSNAAQMAKAIGPRRHLDYGGGNGLMAKLLRESGFDSTSFDPMDEDGNEADLGTFDVITAFEVFEHTPDPRSLMKYIGTLLRPGGVVYFSTLLSDVVKEPLKWWYLAPRNGHISLFTRRSLQILAARNGYRFFTDGALSHAFMARAA